MYFNYIKDVCFDSQHVSISVARNANESCFLLLKSQCDIYSILLDVREDDEKDKDGEKSKEGGYGFAGLPKGAENLTPKERHVLR